MTDSIIDGAKSMTEELTLTYIFTLIWWWIDVKPLVDGRTSRNGGIELLKIIV